MLFLSCGTPPAVIPLQTEVPQGVHWASDTIGGLEPIELSEEIDTIWSVDKKHDKDFMVGGYQEGDTVPPVMLYNTREQLFDLDSVLNENEYVLFVSGSYTCPMFFREIDELKRIANKVPEVKVTIVNTVNAHPEEDKSPYLGEVWDEVESNTIPVGSCRLARTFGERLEITREMVEFLNINDTVIEVLIDDVENEWWMNFGMTPNGTYLIGRGRVVLYRQPKFNANNMRSTLKKLIKP